MSDDLCDCCDDAEATTTDGPYRLCGECWHSVTTGGPMARLLAESFADR